MRSDTGQAPRAALVLACCMGFASGLPLLLTGSVLQAWMTERGIDLTTIGLFALVGLPYSLKFLWSPLLDRYAIPGLGRRRGWLLLAQLALASLLILLAGVQIETQRVLVAAIAVGIAFWSATQDAVVDAYRRESLSEAAQGPGASLYVTGYRLGMLLASGGGLLLADRVGFRLVYLAMAAIMGVLAMVTLAAREPPRPEGAPGNFRAAVVLPFVDYFQRPQAISILLFILLYKLGDTMAGQMTIPFYLALGYSKTEIGTVVKLFGFGATVAGGLCGGALMWRAGLFPSLLLFGMLQALSTGCFALLTEAGGRLPALAAVIGFENLTAGMGTAAFLAFIAAQTDRRFSATQFALLSSLIGIPRSLVAAPTGLMVDWLGWPLFFGACALVAMPGLLLLLRLRPAVVATEPKRQPGRRPA